MAFVATAISKSLETRLYSAVFAPSRNAPLALARSRNVPLLAERGRRVRPIFRVSTSRDQQQRKSSPRLGERAPKGAFGRDFPDFADRQVLPKRAR
jgi:hypothetical protein